MKLKEIIANRARAAAWNKANKERRREIKRRSYLANREKSLTTNRTWYRRNKDKMQTVNQRWKKAHPGKVIEYSARRRAMKKKLTAEKISSEQLCSLLKRQKNRCFYCRCRLGCDKHLDHVVPLSRQGLHVLANLAWACQYCNLSKGKKLLSEWIDRPGGENQTNGILQLA